MFIIYLKRRQAKQPRPRRPETKRTESTKDSNEEVNNFQLNRENAYRRVESIVTKNESLDKKMENNNLKGQKSTYDNLDVMELPD